MRTDHTGLADEGNDARHPTVFMHGEGFECSRAQFSILHFSVCIGIFFRFPLPLLIFPFYEHQQCKVPGTGRRTAVNRPTRRRQRGSIGNRRTRRRERGATARTARVESKGREGQSGGELCSLAGSPKPGGSPQASLARSPAPSPDRHTIAQAPLARKPRPQARQPEPGWRRAPSPPEPQTGAKAPDTGQGSHD